MDKKRLMAGGTLVLTLVLGGTVYLLSRDEIAPELRGVKNLTVDVADKGKFNPLKGVSAEDNKDGDITKSIKLSDLDVKKAGKQSLTYTVEDKKGNKSEKTITITITDKVAEEKKKAEEARLKAEAEAKAKAEAEAKAAEEARVLAEQQAQAEAEAQRQAQSQASGGGGSQSSGGGGYSSSNNGGGGSSYTPPAQSSGGGNSDGSSYTPPASEEPSFNVGNVETGYHDGQTGMQ